MPQSVTTPGQGRVWIQPSGPNTAFLYSGCYGMGDVTIPEGDISNIYCPSSTQPNEWDVVAQTKGTPGNATTSLEAPLDLVNYLLSIKCPFGVQLRFTRCNRPDDPASWESMLVFRDAQISSRGVTNLNGRTPDNNESEVLVTAELTFAEMTFVKTLTWTSQQVTSTANATIKDIAFCDDVTCAGECGAGSTGCQVGYVITTGAASEEVWKTINGGATWTEIANPFAAPYTDDIVAIACKSNTVILVNGTTASQIAKSVDGGTSWSIIDAGGAQIISDVYMYSSAQVWMCGANGRVWYSDDGGASWTVQDAGVAAGAVTLNEIFMYDDTHGMAVGNSGAIIATTDGETWAAQSSGVATNLNTVAMTSRWIAFVGGASGVLLVTTDGGTTWVAKTYPGAGTDSINVIVFYDNILGWLGSTTAAAAGKIYRTLDGGYTWTQAEVLPTNAGINAIWVCSPNKVFAATDTAGTIIKGA